MTKHLESYVVVLLITLFFATPASQQTRSRRPSSNASQTKQRVWRNKIGMEFVLIPRGSFTMGSNNGDANEKPVHQVTLSRPFYMSKFLVTLRQWQALMGNNFRENFAGASQAAGRSSCPSCPVVYIAWPDAQAFVRRLNQMHDGFDYRLPTEAEWEYACRAGKGEDYAPTRGNQPNAFGLYHMTGDTWQWLEDRYHGNYETAPSDASAWINGGAVPFRVLRGGNDASNSSSSLRCAYRQDY